jgi:hypothetical protein
MSNIFVSWGEHIRGLTAAFYSVLKIPRFPLLDSLRVYRGHGFAKAARWFFVRLLVPFGISQTGPGREAGIVGEIREFGYAVLPRRSEGEVAELIDYFLQEQRSIDSQTYRNLSEYFRYWRSRSILRPSGLNGSGRSDCPLTRLSRDPAIVDVVCRFLGLPAHRIRVLATIDALIRVEGKGIRVGGYDAAVEFHRDIDSWKWIKVFVYLTDTNDGDGHHEMVPRSHLRTPISLLEIRRYTQAEIFAAMPNLELKKICGPAGYTFIENTFAFHRGTEPSKSDRLIAILAYYDDAISSWLLADETFPLITESRPLRH